MSFRREPYLLDTLSLGDGPGNLGLALATGRLVATVVSAKTGKHVSVQLQAKRKEGKRFRACALYEAERIYADVPREGGATGAEIGCLHLVGRWAMTIMPPWEGQLDPSRLWAMRRVLDVAQDLAPLVDEQASILEGKVCLLCGRELTDPESIERNIGPECWSKAMSLFAGHGEHAAPGDRDVFEDEGNAEDGANGYQVPDGANADEALDALARQGFVDALEEVGREVRGETGFDHSAAERLTQEQIDAELAQTAKLPAAEDEPEPLGVADEPGELYSLGADQDPRALLEEAQSHG